MQSPRERQAIPQHFDFPFSFDIYDRLRPSRIEAEVMPKHCRRSDTNAACKYYASVIVQPEMFRQKIDAQQTKENRGIYWEAGIRKN